MHRLFCRKTPCTTYASQPGTGKAAVPGRLGLLVTLSVWTAAVVSTPAARADSYAFSFTGNGITANGTLQVQNTGPLGAYTVTGIAGTFLDTNNNVSGAITGLEYAPPPVFNAPPAPAGTFGAPAFTAAGFSYDNLFWPDGNSPAVCAEALAYYGGDFDIYGMAFDVAGGYTVDVWSNGAALGGYQLDDSLGAVKLGPDNMEGIAYGVNATITPTPEPGSLLLLGTGLTGVVAAARRRRTPTAPEAV